MTPQGPGLHELAPSEASVRDLLAGHQLDNLAVAAEEVGDLVGGHDLLALEAMIAIAAGGDDLDELVGVKRTGGLAKPAIVRKQAADAGPREQVQSRLSHMVARAKARRYRVIHDLDENGDNSAEIEVSLRADDVRKQPVARIGTTEVLGRVRAEVSRGARDEEVIALLDGLIAGLRTGEICRQQGWSEQEHENVVRRLRTIALGMPESLRRALQAMAIEAMRPAAPVLLRASDAEDDDPAGEDDDELSSDGWEAGQISSDGEASVDFE